MRGGASAAAARCVANIHSKCTHSKVSWPRMNLWSWNISALLVLHICYFLTVVAASVIYYFYFCYCCLHLQIQKYRKFYQHGLGSALTECFTLNHTNCISKREEEPWWRCDIYRFRLKSRTRAAALLRLDPDPGKFRQCEAEESCTWSSVQRFNLLWSRIKVSVSLRDLKLIN